MTAQDWMREALKEAQLALEQGEIPVGAVVVRDGELIARAHNEREESRDPTAHAELLALRRASQCLGDWRLQGCTLYVTLEPCPMCSGAIAMSRLSRVVFGAFDPQAGCCGSTCDLCSGDYGPGCAVVGGLMAEECSALLEGFFHTKR